MKYKTKKRKQHKAERKTSELAKKVAIFAAPICNAEGIELIYVEYVNMSGNRKLCIYIDKEGGVSIEDCALISKQLGNLLDLFAYVIQFFRVLCNQFYPRLTGCHATALVLLRFGNV